MNVTCFALYLNFEILSNLSQKYVWILYLIEYVIQTYKQYFTYKTIYNFVKIENMLNEYPKLVSYEKIPLPTIYFIPLVHLNTQQI